MLSKEKSIEYAEKYYEDIYLYCYSHLACNKEDAEDVTQDVFLCFQERVDDLSDFNIRSWLYNVARIKIYEFLRRSDIESEYKSLDDESERFDESLVFNDAYFDVSDEVIEKCKADIINSLSEKDRRIYDEVFINKKQYVQVAQEVGLSENAVRARVCRLRNKAKRKATLLLLCVALFLTNFIF